MQPSRRTQPYRKASGRQPGAVLQAMRKGRTAFGQNPQDVRRASAKGARGAGGLGAAIARKKASARRRNFRR